MNRKLKAALLGLFAATALIVAQKKMPPPPPSEQSKEIAGYRKWAKVNNYPVQMAKDVAKSCVWPGYIWKDSAVPNHGNPHFNKFIIVYVNNAGRAAMLEQETPQFPVGSVIVKEKLPSEKSKEPELLTVMIKREAGYNAESGDWEYLTADGKGEKITARGKLETCNACHVGVKDTDYIFRSYLSYEAKAKLR